MLPPTGKISPNAADLADIECFVTDMDGTLYLGNTPIEGAVDFYKRVKTLGKKLYFFTNNCSKSPGDYVDKLNRLGFDGVARSDIMTSGDVTIDYIKKNAENPRVYLAGTPVLQAQFDSAGIELLPEDAASADFAVLAFDTTLTYAKADCLCRLISAGVPFLATNVDRVCPLEGGAFMPDCGSMAAMIEHATGVPPKFMGKPFNSTVEYIKKYTGVPANRTALIGDRLYTDIKTAVNGGFVGIAVLSGEIGYDDIVKSDIKPDYILNSVKDIVLAAKSR